MLSPHSTSVLLDQASALGILAIFYPPLKYLGGCFWLFYKLRRETPISQNWLKGRNMATMALGHHGASGVKNITVCPFELRFPRNMPLPNVLESSIYFGISSASVCWNMRTVSA